jgi:hypothetical protein
MEKHLHYWIKEVNIEKWEHYTIYTVAIGKTRILSFNSAIIHSMVPTGEEILVNHLLLEWG